MPAAAPAAAGADEPKTEQEIIRLFQQLRGDVGNINDKIGELEADQSEHTLVIGAR